MSIIVTQTNHNIARARNTMSEKFLAAEKNRVQDTDEIEIRALFGLMYLRGCLSQTKHDINHLFGDDGHHGFGATMSKNRFAFLLAKLSFDDKLTRSRRWQTDKFAAMRDILEHFNGNCGRYMSCETHLALDETLFPTRGSFAFRQYNKNKPAKYGILFRSINAITFRYTHSIIVDAGRPDDIENSHFYIPTTLGKVQKLVQNLLKHQKLSGRTISTDNLYTGIPAAEWLLSHNIMLVGTIQLGRIGIPAEIKDTKNRENFSYEISWEKERGDMSLHSYVVKTKSKGKKNVLMLSTRPPQNGKVLVCKMICRHASQSLV